MLHMGAVLPNLGYTADAHYHHLVDDVIVGGKMRYQDGAIAVPTGPELGVALDPEKVRRYHELFNELGGYNDDRDPGRPGWYPLVPNDRWSDPAVMRRPALATLAGLPASVARPAYDPGTLGIGIVPLGVGNFHRAHQAADTDSVLAQDPAWGIAGVSLQRPDMHDALAPQDGLYALIERGAYHRERLRVIGALRALGVAARQPQAVIARMADPATRIVSLTVTEKRYCRTPQGALALADPAVIADLAAPDSPQTALGYLLAACARRHAAGQRGFTVLSCDNLAGNGRMTKSLLLQFAQAQAEGAGGRGSAGGSAGAGGSARDLPRWIEREVSFPDGMVDRIVPHSTAALREQVQGALGLRDAWPVATESFSQWVLEDRFVAGRPPWQLGGVQFVDDVAPFEEMKLRLLNAAHSAIAYLAVPADLVTVDAAMAEPVLRRFIERFIERFWREEAIPALPPVLADRTASYCLDLMTRFDNTVLEHRTAQIAMDGSQKLPLRLLPTLRDRLAAGAGFEACALVIAAWVRFLRGRTESGAAYAVHDPLAQSLQGVLAGAGESARAQSGAVLGLTGLFGAGLFGADLSGHAGLRDTVATQLAGLARFGTLGWLARCPVGGGSR